MVDGRSAATGPLEERAAALALLRHAAGCVDSDIGPAECATLGDDLDPGVLLFEEVVVAGDVLHVATRATRLPSPHEQPDPARWCRA